VIKEKMIDVYSRSIVDFKIPTIHLYAILLRVRWIHPKTLHQDRLKVHPKLNRRLLIIIALRLSNLFPLTDTNRPQQFP
jgi:hypothetical protein